MNKKKILYGLIAVSIAAVNVSLNNESVLNDVTLANAEALAQEAGGKQAITGPRTPVQVYCEKTITIAGSNNNGAANNSSWYAGGSINAGYGPISGSINGGYASGGNNSSGSSSSAATAVKEKYFATKYLCPSQNKTSCTPFDPCLQ